MKPTIPRQVADALELLRSQQRYNAVILELVIDRNLIAGPSVLALRSIPFDTLLAALVNGYDVEKTAEEVLHGNLRKYYEKYSEDDAWDRRYKAGYRMALWVAGINVEGVNA